ncbi:MAG: hypothetical protein WC370_06330 [Dehalococcoidales bacterium]
MLPNEILILMAIVADARAGKKILSHLLDISGEYIGYFYNSLVNRGYLKHHGLDGYQLTAAGREAISGLLKKSRATPKDIVAGLRALGITLSPEQAQKIEKTAREAVRAG